MTLPVTIMAHAARRALAEALAARFPYDTPSGPQPARIVWDPDPAGEPNALRTFRALMASTPHASIVMQEDAIPCVGFAAAATSAAAAAGPDVVVCLYAGRLLRAVPLLRAAAGRCETIAHLGTREYVPTVAFVLPAGLGPRFASWAETNTPDGYRHDDELFAAFCRDHGVDVVTTVPCLANHDNTVESVAGHEAHGARSAWCWIGDYDARSIRWAR